MSGNFESRIELKSFD